MKADDAGGSAFLQPFGQRGSLPDAQPAEIEDLKLGPASCVQSGDTVQGLDIVIKGRADEDADPEIGPVKRGL